MSQRLIPTGEQFGLHTRVAATGSATLCVRDEKLTAFVELESAIRVAANWLDELAGFFPDSALTDLNQAEDISPLGSSSLPDPQRQNQLSGAKERKEEL